MGMGNGKNTKGCAMQSKDAGAGGERSILLMTIRQGGWESAPGSSQVFSAYVAESCGLSCVFCKCISLAST